MTDCHRHGQFIGHDCPVCAGRSTGRSWSTIVGPRWTRQCSACANLSDYGSTDCESCGASLGYGRPE